MNGIFILKHDIGHLPFEAEITPHIIFGKKNRLTVAVDNRLFKNTVPQGKITSADSDDGKIMVQTYSFDFFNYAGIHRYISLKL